MASWSIWHRDNGTAASDADGHASSAAGAPATARSGSGATSQAGRAGHSSGAGPQAGRAGKPASGTPQAGHAGAPADPSPRHDAGTLDAGTDRRDADVVAHEDSGAEDDAGGTDVDGVYACRGGQPYANDCTDPLIDSAFQSSAYVWTLAVSGNALSTTSIGFDQDHIACSGSWSGDLFNCSAEWSRAGRVCNNMLHVRRESNDTLTFWIGTRDQEVAHCAARSR